MTLNTEAFAKALAAGIAAYEAAVVDNSDGWIGWLGGEFPVSRGTRVDVKFRRGNQISGYEVECWYWNHAPEGSANGGDGDIVAYRLAK